MNNAFVEKERDTALQVNNITITERQYFVFDGKNTYRRTTYIQNNKVIAWAMFKEHKDPELHMSMEFADNPREKLMVEFIMRRCGVPRDQLIILYSI